MSAASKSALTFDIAPFQLSRNNHPAQLLQIETAVTLQFTSMPSVAAAAACTCWTVGRRTLLLYCTQGAARARADWSSASQLPRRRRSGHGGVKHDCSLGSRLRHGTHGLDASACLLPWCVLVRVLHSCQASSRWRACYTWMGEPIYPTLAKRAHRFPTCPTLTTTAFPTHATIASTRQTRYSETLTRTTSVTRTCQLEAGWASDFNAAALTAQCTASRRAFSHMSLDGAVAGATTVPWCTIRYKPTPSLAAPTATSKLHVLGVTIVHIPVIYAVARRSHVLRLRSERYYNLLQAELMGLGRGKLTDLPVWCVVLMAGADRQARRRPL